MKTLKRIMPGAIIVVMIQACNTEPNTTDMNDKHSAGSFELNVHGHNDTINMIYADGSKEGHWISSVWSNGSRVKMEEGYYKDNKKEGYWKFFNKDGSLKDSVEYKNDVAISK